MIKVLFNGLKTIFKENIMKLPIYAFVLDATSFRHGNYGTHNGYVAVPSNHPWYSKAELEINMILPMYIHEGVTYSYNYSMEDVNSENFKLEQIIPTEQISLEELAKSNYWLVGFDTAHSNDTPETWNKTAVRAETEKLYLMAKIAYVEYLKGN